MFNKLMQPIALKKNNECDQELVTELFADKSWIMEKKYDGRRFQIVFHNGIFYFADKYAREDKLQMDKKLVETLKMFNTINLPNDIHLDVEIMIPGKFEETLSLYRGTVETAHALQATYGFAEIRIIDVLNFNEDLQDVPLEIRRDIVLRNFSDVELIKPVEGFLLEDEKENEYLRIIDSEEDGVVFKLLESPYIYGTSKLWYKYKRIETHDVIVLNIVEGKDRFVGMAKHVIVGQYHNGIVIEVAHVGNMNYENRYEIWQRRDELKGTVIEILASKKTKNKYRDTRFFRFRDDKDPAQCIW